MTVLRLPLVHRDRDLGIVESAEELSAMVESAYVAAHIDDADEPAPEREPLCDNCADMGCPKCVPDYAQTYSLAAALDRIFNLNLTDGIA